MTEATPTRRTQRQREQRRAERQQERRAANAALRDAVRAIGGGDADFWDQDTPDGISPVTEQKTGVQDDE